MMQNTARYAACLFTVIDDISPMVDIDDTNYSQVRYVSSFSHGNRRNGTDVNRRTIRQLHRQTVKWSI